jgi:hypothetical protein
VGQAAGTEDGDRSLGFGPRSWGRGEGTSTLNREMLVALPNPPLQRTAASTPLGGRLMPRRRGLRPRLFAAVLRPRRPFAADR